MLGRKGPRQGEGEPCGLTTPTVTAPGPTLKSCFLLPNYLKPHRLPRGIPRLGPAPEPRHTGQGHEEGFGSGLLSLRWLWHHWEPGKHPWMLIKPRAARSWQQGCLWVSDHHHLQPRFCDLRVFKGSLPSSLISRGYRELLVPIAPTGHGGMLCLSVPLPIS